MSESKITPITGKHTTMYSFLAEAMGANPKGGFVIYFDGDGVMHPGHFGVVRSESCMAAIWLNRFATDTMAADQDETLHPQCGA